MRPSPADRGPSRARARAPRRAARDVERNLAFLGPLDVPVVAWIAGRDLGGSGSGAHERGPRLGVIAGVGLHAPVVEVRPRQHVRDRQRNPLRALEGLLRRRDVPALRLGLAERDVRRRGLCDRGDLRVDRDDARFVAELRRGLGLAAQRRQIAGRVRERFGVRRVGIAPFAKRRILVAAQPRQQRRIRVARDDPRERGDRRRAQPLLLRLAS